MEARAEEEAVAAVAEAPGEGETSREEAGEESGEVEGEASREEAGEEAEVREAEAEAFPEEAEVRTNSIWWDGMVSQCGTPS